MATAHKIALEVTLDNSGVARGAQQVADAVEDIGDAGRKAAAAYQSAAQNIVEADRQTEAQSKSTSDAVARSNAAIVASVQRKLAAFEAGSAGTAGYFQALQKMREEGAHLPALLNRLAAAETEHAAKSQAASQAAAQAEEQGARTTVASVQRKLAAYEAGSTGTAKYYESLQRLQQTTADLPQWLNRLAQAETEHAAKAKAAAQAAEQADEQNTRTTIANIQRKLAAYEAGSTGTAKYHAALASLQKETADLPAWLARLAQAEAEHAASVDKSSKTIVANIQRKLAAYEAGSSGTQQYYAALNRISREAADLPTLLNRLSVAEAGHVARMKEMGPTARQTAQAMSMLPAQITDIGTSLASGMPIWLVAIQQGGQINDSFGGIGNAAKAIAGSITPMVAGLGVAAAALGVLAYGAAQAEGSLRGVLSLNAQLSAIGNDIGIEGIKSLISELDKIPGVSRDAAREIAATITTTKELGSNTYPALTAMLADFAAASGKTVPDAAKELSEALKKPAEGAAKLDEQYNFLTAGQLATIQSMVDLGQEAQAQQVIIDALSGHVQGLSNDAMTPLQRATNELHQEWGTLMEGLSNSQVWSDVLGGVTRFVNSLSDVIGQLDKISKHPAVSSTLSRASVPPTFRAISDLTGGISRMFGGSSASATAAAGSQVSTGTVEVRGHTAAVQANAAATEKAVKEALNFAQAHIQTAAAANKGKTELKAMKDAHAALTAEGKGATQEAKRLKDGIDALTASMAKKNKGSGGGRGTGTSAADNELTNIRARIKAEEELIRRLQDRTVSNDKLTAGEQLVLRLQEQLGGKLDARTRAVKQQTLAEAQRLAGLEKTRIEHEAARKAEEEYDKARLASLETLRRQNSASREQVARLQEQIEYYGKTAAEIEAAKTAQMALNVATLESQAPDLIDPDRLALLKEALGVQTQIAAKTKELDLSAYQQQHQEALRAAREQAELLELEASLAGQSGDLRARIVGQREAELVLAREIERVTANTALTEEEKSRRIVSAQMLAAQQASNAARKAQTAWQQSITDSVVDAGREAWLSFGDEGISAVEQIGKTLKSAVMDYIYQLTIKPILVNVVGSITGGGVGGLTGGAGTSWGGLLNAGQSIWSAYSGSLVSGMAGAVGQLGSILGSSALNSFSMGMSGLAGPVANAGWAAAGGMVGTALPWVAGLTAAYSLIKKLDNSGTPHMGAEGLWSTYGGSENYNRGLEQYSPDVGKSVEGLAASIGETLQSFTRSLGERVDWVVKTGWADDFDGKGNSWGDFEIRRDGQTVTNWRDGPWDSKWSPREFAEGSAGYEEYVTAAMQSVVKAMQETMSSGWQKDILSGLGDDASLAQIQSALSTITAITQQFKLWGDAITGFAGLTDAAITRLADYSGGIDGLATNVGAYYQNFYSEQERAAAVTQQMTDALAQYGQELPATREAYRGMVETALASGESGAELAAVLLGMSATFAQVVGETVATTEEVANAGRSAADILKERQQLEKELLEIRGDQAALIAQEREQIHETNLALFDRVQIERAAVEAAQAAAQAEQQLVQQRASLEEQIFKLQGDEEAIRQRTLQSLPEALRGMQEQVWALEAQAEAAQAAAQAEQQLAQQRVNLEEQIFKLQGDEEAIRQRTLQSLPEALHGMQEQVWALEAQAEAAQAAAQAEQQLAQQRVNLEEQIFRLQGDEEAIRQRTLQSLPEALRGMQEQVWALEAQAEAAQAAAQAEQQLAQQRVNLEEQIFKLQGDEEAIRQRTLQSLPEALRGMQEQVWALEAQAEAAQAAAQAEQQLAQQRVNLEEQIFKLQGDEEAIRQRTLQSLPEALRGMQEQVWALEAQAEAAQAAAQAEQQLAQQRVNLEEQIFKLQGDEEAIRRRTLDALPEALHGMQEQVWALEAQAEAAQAATQAEQQLAQQRQAIDNERQGIDRQIYQLLGNTQALRDMELAGMYEENRARQQYLYDLQDEKSVWEAAQGASAQAASAGASIRDSLLDAARSIRGEMVGESAQGLAYYQAQFAITTAQARAGDADAAQRLGGIGQTLARLEGSNAGSNLDALRAQARIAASIEETSRLAPQNAPGGGGASVSAAQFVSQLTPPSGLSGSLPDATSLLSSAFDKTQFEQLHSSSTEQSNALSNMLAELKSLRSEMREASEKSERLQREVAFLLGAWNAQGLPESRDGSVESLLEKMRVELVAEARMSNTTMSGWDSNGLPPTRG